MIAEPLDNDRRRRGLPRFVVHQSRARRSGAENLRNPSNLRTKFGFVLRNIFMSVGHRYVPSLKECSETRKSLPDVTDRSQSRRPLESPPEVIEELAPAADLRIAGVLDLEPVGAGRVRIGAAFRDDAFEIHLHGGVEETRIDGVLDVADRRLANQRLQRALAAP